MRDGSVWTRAWTSGRAFEIVRRRLVVVMTGWHPGSVERGLSVAGRTHVEREPAPVAELRPTDGRSGKARTFKESRQFLEGSDAHVARHPTRAPRQGFIRYVASSKGLTHY